MKIKKIIFVSQASHLASIWNRGLEQLGNGLIVRFIWRQHKINVVNMIHSVDGLFFLAVSFYNNISPVI